MANNDSTPQQAKKEWVITPEQWTQAESFLQDKPNGTKIDRKGGGDISFVKIENQIFAMTNKKFFDPLGEGTFGTVKMIENKEGARFAVKIEGRGARGEQDAEKRIGEITGFLIGEASRALDKPKDFKGKVTNQKLYTVMQLQPGKDIAKHIYGDHQNKPLQLNDTQKLLIALKCCQSVQTLHDKRTIHADIKPANFVTDINGNQITLGAVDFGFSMIKQADQEVIVAPWKGSHPYMAPELGNDKRHKACFSNASDVFALGKMFENDLNLSPHVFQDMLTNDPTQRASINSVITKLISELENRSDLDSAAQQIIIEARKFVINHKMQTQQQTKMFQSQFPNVYSSSLKSELERMNKEINRYEKEIELRKMQVSDTDRMLNVAVKINNSHWIGFYRKNVDLLQNHLKTAQEGYNNAYSYAQQVSQRLVAFNKAPDSQSQPYASAAAAALSSVSSSEAANNGKNVAGTGKRAAFVGFQRAVFNESMKKEKAVEPQKEVIVRSEDRVKRKLIK